MLCAARQAGSVNSCHVAEGPSVSAELELLKGSTLLTHRGCKLKGIYFWGWPHIIPVYATDTSTLVEVRPGDTFVVSQNNCSDREKSVFCLPCCESVQLEQNWRAHPRDGSGKPQICLCKSSSSSQGPCPAGLPGQELCKLAKVKPPSFYWSCWAVEPLGSNPLSKGSKVGGGGELSTAGEENRLLLQCTHCPLTGCFPATPPRVGTSQIRALITMPGSATSEQQQH